MVYIKRHNYIPEYILHKCDNENDSLYLGIELEVDEGGESESNAKIVLDMLNKNAINAYCTHDGSLNNGFEIDTMPCTLKYHKENINYKKVFSFLTDLNYKSHDTKTCGMHIHVNRTFFGNNRIDQDIQICKLAYVFHKFKNHIFNIARRGNNCYARDIYTYGNNEMSSIIGYYGIINNIGKYSMINVMHENTIELRIFKGTLNYNTFMCTLEFVTKICSVIKNYDLYKIEEIKWEDIQKTFSKKLNDYIDSRNKKKEKNENIIIEVPISENPISENPVQIESNFSFNNPINSSPTIGDEERCSNSSPIIIGEERCSRFEPFNSRLEFSRRNEPFRREIEAQWVGNSSN